MTDRRQLLIGLPESGKTTFLAALWHVVEAGEIPSVLELVELRGDRTHLNNIRACWLGCRQVVRTVVGAEKLVTLLLADRESGARTELLLPDMSGESFKLQWRDRQWTPDYGTLVSASGGGLLVIHPRQVREAVRIDEADVVHAEIAQPAPTDVIDGDTIAWDPDLCPTQTQLVDLLQFLMEQVSVSPFRLAVMVSAWDLVDSSGLSPDAWCAKRLPLLDQFLRANAEQFSVRYYGISAQGGDLKTDGERLQRVVSPSTRIRVEGEDCAPHDLSAPVRWVMG